MRSKVKYSLQLFAVVLIGLLGVIAGALLISMILRTAGIADSYPGKITMTWFAMALGLFFLPTLLFRWRYHFSLQDSGIRYPGKLQTIVCLCLIGGTLLYLCIVRENVNPAILVVAILQNAGVAIFEEYYSKAILFYGIKKITDNKVAILLLSSCIFAFVLHNEGSLDTNLMYRFPMALLLGGLYLRTGNLALPVTLHFVNNLLATSVFNG